MKISARREVREQNRLRRTLERNLSTQLLKLFRRLGNEVGKALEESQSIEGVLNTIQDKVSSVLLPHYRVTIQKFTQRASRRKNTAEDFIAEFIRSEGGQHIRGISSTTRNQIMKVVLAGEQEGLGNAVIAKNIREQMQGSFSRYRANTIARTETHSASSYSNHGIARVARDSGIRMVKQWVSTLDGRTRQHHVNMNGKQAEMDEDFIVPYKGFDYAMSYTGDPRGGAPNTINCRCVTIYVEQGVDEVVDDKPVETRPTTTEGGFGFTVQPKEKTVALSPAQAKEKVQGFVERGSLDDAYDRVNKVYDDRKESDFGNIGKFDDETNQFLASCIDDIEKICNIFKVPMLRGFTADAKSNASMGDGVMALNTRKLFKKGLYSKTEMNHPQSPRVVNTKITEEQWANAKERARKKRYRAEKTVRDYARWDDEDLKVRSWSVKDYWDNDYDKMRSTIFHELGHHIHQMTGWSASNPKTRKAVYEITHKKATSLAEVKMYDRFQGLFNRKSPTLYGDTKVVEWFAENFSLWAMGRKDLLSPDFEVFIKELIDEAK